MRYTVLSIMLGTALGMLTLASGCSSEIACKDACACEGLAGDKLCIDQCATDRAAVVSKAKQAQCSSQQSDFTLCAADNASCDTVKKQYAYPIESCKTESDALSKCFGSGAGASSSTGSKN